MAGKAMLRVFQLPGNVVSDATGAREDADRIMIRSLVDMQLGNLVVALVVVARW